MAQVHLDCAQRNLVCVPERGACFAKAVQVVLTTSFTVRRTAFLHYLLFKAAFRSRRHALAAVQFLSSRLFQPPLLFHLFGSNFGPKQTPKTPKGFGPLNRVASVFRSAKPSLTDARLSLLTKASGTQKR